MKKFTKLLTAGVMAASLFSVSSANAAPPDHVPDHVKEKVVGKLEGNKYIIYFEDKEKGKGLLKAEKAKIRKDDFKSIPNAVSVEMPEQAVKGLLKNPNIKYIEPITTAKPLATYSKHYPDSWQIPAHHGLDELQEGDSGEGVKVAVLDSGIKKDHPAFEGVIAGGASVVPWTTDYTDHTGHGTKVAGALASKKDGKPTALAPDVDLYPVVITKSMYDGGTELDYQIAGIEWAVDNDMDIANLSFESNHGLSLAMQEAIHYARSNDTLVILAAGNSGKGTANSTCDIEGVYCVGSINSSGNLSDFSSTSPTGTDRIDFVAGGEGVFLPNKGVSYAPNGWGFTSGTSFSAPTAAGALAVLKGKYPNLSVYSLAEHLKETAQPLSTGTSADYGEGKIVVTDVDSRIGYRQSFTPTEYSIGQSIVIHTIAGDGAKGVIDNYPLAGAKVTHEFRHYDAFYGVTTRYKTISATTDLDGRTRQVNTFTDVYPKGDYILQTTIEHNGKREVFIKKFRIKY